VNKLGAGCKFIHFSTTYSASFRQRLYQALPLLSSLRLRLAALGIFSLAATHLQKRQNPFLKPFLHTAPRFCVAPDLIATLGSSCLASGQEEAHLDPLFKTLQEQIEQNVIGQTLATRA
jgi:hypothetical protein